MAVVYYVSWKFDFFDKIRKSEKAQWREEADLEFIIKKTLKHKHSEPRRDRQASPLRTT